MWARVFDAEEKGPGVGLSICLLLTQCVFAPKRAQRLWSLQGHNTLFLLRRNVYLDFKGFSYSPNFYKGLSQYLN